MTPRRRKTATHRGSSRGHRRGRHVLALLNWSTPELIRGILQYARQALWSLDVPFVVWWGTPPEAVLPSADNPVDGMLACLFNIPSLFSGLAPVPTVSLSSVHPPWASAVLADDDAIGRLGAAALLERGFHHLAFIGGYGHPHSQARGGGFTHAAAEGGASLVGPGQSAELDHLDPVSLGREIAQWPKPVGIMGFNDRSASRVVRACRVAGLAVPEQVAVIGVGNEQAVCELTPVPISSVRLDDYRHGYEAARLLDGLMNGRATAKEPVLIAPLGVEHRQSTDILAVADLNVARALRYLWENHANPRLAVTDVADFAGMSISSLNNAFKEHLGTPIGWQIRHKRLTAAMGLLAGSGRTIRDIAAQCGYRDEEHLRSTLRKQTGLSPRAWRKRNRQDD